MLKRNLIFFIILAVVFSVFAGCNMGDVPPPDQQPTESAKYICSEEHRIQYSTDGSATETTTKYTYNENNLLLKQVSYDKNGNEIERHEYEYDENETQIYEIAYTNGAKSYEYKYDGQGNMTSEIIYNADGSVLSSDSNTYTYENTYYPDGKICTETCYIDSLEGFYYYKGYNLNGYLVETTYRGEQYVVTTYQYKNGICVYSDEHVNHAASREKRYDSNGNLTKETVYNQQYSTPWYDDVYEYDDHNNCTKIIRCYYDGTIVQISDTEYTYNENGTIKTKTEYNVDGSVLYKITYSDPVVVQQTK